MLMAINSRILRIILFIFALAAFCPFTFGKIIYVDDDALVSSFEDSNGGKNNGTSWENAYIYLQDALADANDSDKPVEIRVAQGAYRPDLGANQTVGDRMATFQLINGVTIAGGYAGKDANDPDARDIVLYESFLYGDLNGNDVAVDDPCDLFYEASRFENSYNIVIAENIDESAVLDGFTITAGFATHNIENLYRYCMGAGLYCYDAGPLIANCTFALNAARDGGGMCNHAGNPNIINCRFISNAARTDILERGNRGAGGGLCNHSGKPVLTGCEFIANSARWGAGIVDFADSDMVVTNCAFIWNLASENGGGLWSQSSNLKLTNCRFTENQASKNGGGIFSFTGNSQLVDCIFENNFSTGGGGCSIESIESSVINCIFIGNNAAIGGGFYNSQINNQDPNNVQSFDGCIFIYNHAQNKGGGIYNYYSNNARFNNCYFIGNSSEYWVGGMSNIETTVTMNHCSFTGNSALVAGGAIGLGLSTGAIRNCTIAHSQTRKGESLFTLDSDVDVTNSIFWGSTEQIYTDKNSEITINYSTIKGGWEGQGNIIVDPLFAQRGYWVNVNDPNIVVDPSDPNAIWSDGDYHLKSRSGRWDPVSQSWVADDVTSPCIDRGDPNTPVGDEPEPNGGRINMGAYGGTIEASKSLLSRPF